MKRMLKRARWSALWLLATAVVGCADLSAYPVGECGNSVVDDAAGEQCDSHVPEGQSCGAPGAAGQCRYVCGVVDAANDPLARFACPDGFACGLDDICHRAADTYELSATDGNFALGSRLGDFDGSRTKDVLTSGLSRLDVSFFDDTGVLASRQSLGGGLFAPPQVGALDAADASGVDHEDAVFTKAGDVVVALGTDNGLSPKSYAGIRLGVEPPVFFFTVPGGLAPQVSISSALALADGPNFKLIELDGEKVVPVMDWPIHDQAPHAAVTANLDPSSPYCHEVVLAYEDFLAVWRPCPNGSSLAHEGDPIGPEDPVVITLDAAPNGGAQALVGAPSLVDLDLDGGKDLVIEVNECAEEEPEACSFFQTRPSDCCHLYVGWSTESGFPLELDGGFASEPGGGTRNVLGRVGDVISYPFESGPAAMHPLGWGDFNGDGFGDFVTSIAAFVSDPNEFGSFVPAAFNTGLPWLSADVADFDGDGLDDVVAVPYLTPALTYLRGNAGSTMGYATIQVERPYSEVQAGDLDGDGRNDILGRTRSADGTRDELTVLYFSDGGFAAPRSIGNFRVDTKGTTDTSDDVSSVLQLAIGKLITTFDSLDDVAAITTYYDAAVGDDRVGIALFEGRADRQLTAPIVITDGGRTVDVGLVTFGHFEGGLASIVADSYLVDLDADLEIRGQSRPIAVLQPDALQASFPAGTAPGADGLLGAGQFDDDPDDELIVAVPGCVDAVCPQGQDTADAELRDCCAEGTETTRLFLFDKVDGDFVPSAALPTPLTLPGLAARGFLDEAGLRLGRLLVTDIDGNGLSEALLLVGSRVGGVLDRRAVLVVRGPNGATFAELPRDVDFDGTVVRTQVSGFSVTHDDAGGALIVVAASEGLYQVPLELAADGTFAFGTPEPVRDATGEELAETEVTGVEAGDVNGDGIDDLVLTRPFATELYLGGESFEPPAGTP